MILSLKDTSYLFKIVLIWFFRSIINLIQVGFSIFSFETISSLFSIFIDFLSCLLLTNQLLLQLLLLLLKFLLLLLQLSLLLLDLLLFLRQSKLLIIMFSKFSLNFSFFKLIVLMFYIFPIFDLTRTHWNKFCLLIDKLTILSRFISLLSIVFQITFIKLIFDIITISYKLSIISLIININTTVHLHLINIAHTIIQTRLQIIM